MINNSSQTSLENISDLRQQRSECFKKIKLLKRQAYHQQIHHLIDEMETATQAACFRSLKYVCSNWKYQPLLLISESNKSIVVNTSSMHNMIRSYYSIIFNQHSFHPDPE